MSQDRVEPALFVSNAEGGKRHATALDCEMGGAASKITIGFVGTGAEAGPTAEELANSLAWRGIKADLCHIEPAGTPVGELLLTHAENLGTDLMIMGAYSRSRLRDMILSGVTRHVARSEPRGHVPATTAPPPAADLRATAQGGPETLRDWAR